MDASSTRWPGTTVPLRSPDWRPARQNEQAKVLSETCGCDPIVFELCQADGLGFIRRTRRTRGDRLIEETDRWQARETEALWIALLYGLVR